MWDFLDIFSTTFLLLSPPTLNIFVGHGPMGRSSAMSCDLHHCRLSSWFINLPNYIRTWSWSSACVFNGPFFETMTCWHTPKKIKKIGCCFATGLGPATGSFLAELHSPGGGWTKTLPSAGLGELFLELFLKTRFPGWFRTVLFVFQAIWEVS